MYNGMHLLACRKPFNKGFRGHNMNKKGLEVCVLFSVVFLFFIPNSSANFACGIVKTHEDISPSWFDVTVYYEEAREFFTTCKVSPDENKYCCDPSEIDQVEWDIGKKLIAQINQDGYLTEPKSLTISGEGYDIFPELVLEKILHIESPNQTLFVNQSKLFFNISTSKQYRNISYSLSSDGFSKTEVLCTNCNHVEKLLENLPSGSYNLNIESMNDSGDTVLEKKEIFFIDNVKFSREINCEGCKEGYIPTELYIVYKENLFFLQDSIS
jgi:hypothetical protein